jgi:hypothetical protein
MSDHSTALGGTCRARFDPLRELFAAKLESGEDLGASLVVNIDVGYGLPWPEVLPFVREGRVCFGSGAGGSMVIADVDRRMTVAYVMNKMAPGMVVWPIAAALVERVYGIVDRVWARHTSGDVSGASTTSSEY